MGNINVKSHQISPYVYICKLDKAIEELKSAVFEQKSEEKRLRIVGKVITLAAKLLSADAYAHQALLKNVSTKQREGLKAASARNTAVAMTAMACAESCLEYSDDFCDLLTNYREASKIARGEDNFKNSTYYGHMMRFSIHNSLSSKTSTKEEIINRKNTAQP